MSNFKGAVTIKKLTKEQLRVAVLDGLIPYAVADSGCTTTCVKPLHKQIKVSECGHYKWAGEPFKYTGKESNKCFSMALGHQAHGQDEVDLSIPLRKEAREAHTLNDVTNNLYSIPKLVQAGYVPIFEKDEMGIYDKRNTKITVSRAAVLNGWYHEGTQLWRIPLVGGGTKR